MVKGVSKAAVMKNHPTGMLKQARVKKSKLRGGTSADRLKRYYKLKEADLKALDMYSNTSFSKLR